MVKDNVPSKTVDFIAYLDGIYPDRMDVLPDTVATADYWKRAGVIELVRTYKHKLQHTSQISGVKDTEA